ncbi:MAG: DUF4197 domain-containing protein [Candidatus Omnitrophica bacterium]|nr:DUF4197 domain-containing protein [Candidatus Omnitrophota bacterium]
MRFQQTVLFLSILLLTYPCQAGWKEQLRSVLKPLQQTSLDDTRIGQGLKEALSIGIDQAVKKAGTDGGYTQNDLIKIRFPEQLALMEKSLRAVGMGSKIEDFENSVNRAAEAAAPQTKGALIDAVMGLSFEDVQKILKGGDTAATDYFKRTTWDRLYQAVSPFMTEALDRYSTLQQYDQLVQAYNKIPFAAKPAFISADQYATTQALNGLFFLIGEQEKEIRTDPNARVTELLRSVFSPSAKT